MHNMTAMPRRVPRPPRSYPILQPPQADTRGDTFPERPVFTPPATPNRSSAAHLSDAWETPTHQNRGSDDNFSFAFLDVQLVIQKKKRDESFVAASSLAVEKNVPRPTCLVYISRASDIEPG